MRDYVFVTDSTCDLPKDIIKELDIKVIPFSYSINDEPYHYYLDERDGDIKDFYDKLRDGAMPATSQVNPNMYKEFFEEIVKEGKDVFYVCFSSGLSGSFQSARLGADMVTDKYEDARIEIIDSLCASLGEGVFVYHAAKHKKEGMDIDTLTNWALDNRLKVGHWFMVEDLYHLKRGGRVSAVEAAVGSALKIKPILSVDEEGKLVVKSKARGTGKALDYLVSKAVEEGKDMENTIFFVGNADAMGKAEKLKNSLIEKGAKEENIIIVSIGPIIGAHVGAGMAAITFLAK
ncbi:MAG: DegV family protein [Lachnospiraceae bacterium]|nr:DegV family protein [Lachnospiraceae bacterium]